MHSRSMGREDDAIGEGQLTLTAHPFPWHNPFMSRQGRQSANGEQPQDLNANAGDALAPDRCFVSELLTTEAAVRTDLKRLFKLNAALDTIQRPILKELEAIILRLAGSTLGSLEVKKTVASEIQSLATRLAVRPVCPKQNCEQPAHLTCSAPPGSPAGCFQFVHNHPRKTSHVGSSTFPAFELGPAPPDGRTRKARLPRTFIPALECKNRD